MRKPELTGVIKLDQVTQLIYNKTSIEVKRHIFYSSASNVETNDLGTVLKCRLNW